MKTFFFLIINDFLQLCIQVSAQTSASLKSGQLSMHSYTISPPSAPPAKRSPEPAFLSISIKEPGLPLAASTTLHLSGCVLPDEYSWKSSLLPVGMASYTVYAFAKPLVLTSCIKPVHRAQPNKVLVALQLLTVNCWPQLIPHWHHHLLSWGRWFDMWVKCHWSPSISMWEGKKKNTEINCPVRCGSCFSQR